MKKLFFPLLAALVSLACEKEDEPEGIDGSWMRTEFYTVDNSGKRSHDLLAFAPDCQKDDIYEFTAGEFFLKEGALSCEPSSAVNDKYVLNGRNIEFENLGIWEISSISQSALEVKQQTATGTGFLEVITIFKKK